MSNNPNHGLNSPYKVSAVPETSIIFFMPPLPVNFSMEYKKTSIQCAFFLRVVRVFRGSLKTNMPVALIKRDGKIVKSRIKDLMLFEGMAKIKVEDNPMQGVSINNRKKEQHIFRKVSEI